MKGGVNWCLNSMSYIYAEVTMAKVPANSASIASGTALLINSTEGMQYYGENTSRDTIPIG